MPLKIINAIDGVFLSEIYITLTFFIIYNSRYFVDKD